MSAGRKERSMGGLTLLREDTKEYVRLRTVYHFGLVLFCRETEHFILPALATTLLASQPYLVVLG